MHSARSAFRNAATHSHRMFGGLVLAALVGGCLPAQVEAQPKLVPPSTALHQGRPAELKIGMTTFLTGPASLFGIPARRAAELFVEELNAGGGINGVPVSLAFIDEALPPQSLAQEFRRVVTDGGARVMLASISSGNCQTLAPVAEELRVLNVMWDCGTDKILEGRRLKYVVRSTGYVTPEMVATAVHLVRTLPKAKRVAVINQDYAYGRESWATLRKALLKLNPDIEIVGEVFPKFGATDVRAELTRIAAARPDVVISTAWGGDLDTIVRQANEIGLMSQAKWVLPLGESSLERLGPAMPPGVIVGMRGDHYFLHPEYRDDFKHKQFVAKFRARTDSYPIYPVYHAVQGLQAVVAAYKESMLRKGGHWPSTEQAAETMRNLLFRGLTRAVRIRADGQGMQEQMLGITEPSKELGFTKIGRLTIYPADLVTPKIGQVSADFLESIEPDMLVYSGIKVF